MIHTNVTHATRISCLITTSIDDLSALCGGSSGSVSLARRRRRFVYSRQRRRNQ
jgi:hypothetical protein